MNHRLARRALAALLPLASAWPLQAQHSTHASHAVATDPDSSAADFLRRARAGASRYADQSLAIADGYRRLGPDFPAMGEHWANPELVAKGTFDPARPPLLTYVRVNGAPTLTGVVFALPLGDGELPPAAPAGVGAWHDHFGSIDDESLLLDHGAQHAPAGELRLAVLHAWLFVANPAGPFVTDNWSLPYARLGIPAPAVAPIAATRALALLADGLPYYEALAERAAAADEAGDGRIRATLERHRDQLVAWWSRRATHAPLTAEEMAQLSTIWTDCWREAGRNLPVAARERLRLVAGEPTDPSIR